MLTDWCHWPCLYMPSYPHRVNPTGLTAVMFSTSFMLCCSYICVSNRTAALKLIHESTMGRDNRFCQWISFNYWMKQQNRRKTLHWGARAPGSPASQPMSLWPASVWKTACTKCSILSNSRCSWHGELTSVTFRSSPALLLTVNSRCCWINQGLNCMTVWKFFLSLIQHFWQDAWGVCISVPKRGDVHLFGYMGLRASFEVLRRSE